MAPVDEFVVKSNVNRFADLLCTEHSADRRQMLQTLLLEQEDRFGFRTWHLDAIETRIATNMERIKQQEALVGWIEGQGQDSKYALMLLNTFRSVHQTLVATKAQVVEMLDTGPLL